MMRTLIAMLLAGVIALNAGCYGSFALTKKVYHWNGSLGDKWLNSIMFWVLNIVPVYGVSTFIDAIVFNVIEFYTHKNPMTFEGDTETHKAVRSNGKVYDIAMGRYAITVTETKGPDAGKRLSIVYRKETSSWLLLGNGKETMIASYEPRPLDRVNLFYPGGKVESMELAFNK